MAAGGPCLYLPLWLPVHGQQQFFFLGTFSMLNSAHCCNGHRTLHFGCSCTFSVWDSTVPFLFRIQAAAPLLFIIHTYSYYTFSFWDTAAPFLEVAHVHCCTCCQEASGRLRTGYGIATGTAEQTSFRRRLFHPLTNSQLTYLKLFL